MVSHTYLPNFKYTNRNVYHGRLQDYSEFVFRNEEGEKFKGQWNQRVFQRSCPLHVEIGTGYGHFMLDFCEKNPDINFVGLDYRFKRSFQLSRRLAATENQNFRYLRALGERLNFLFNHGEVDSLYYFFPDPWPKRKQNKRRLFQAPFLEATSNVLKPGGLMYIKTDHQDYFKWMLNEVHRNLSFDIELLSWDLHTEHPEHFLAQFPTKFEKIFLAQKIPIKALVLKNLEGTWH